MTTTAPICESCVLIVDDDEDIRSSLAEVLQDSGFRPIEAANGREAKEHIEGASEVPCAILLDMMMPVMDGWAFRAWQEQDPKASSIPVVVVSAHANVDEAAQKMKVAAALRKPVQLDDLLEIIGRFCRPDLAAEGGGA